MRCYRERKNKVSCYIGIDIGGMSIKAGVVNSEDLSIMASHSVKTPQCGGEGFCAACFEALENAVTKAGIAKDDIKGIGIGAPGVSDKEKGVLVYVGTINYDNAKIREYLTARINVPVLIENDANAAVIGEYLQRKKSGGMSCFILLTIGTGVGGGIIINDRLHIGINGVGAEIGHIVTHKDGKICECGRTGCLEAYASMTALIESAKEKSAQLGIPKADINGKTIFEAADLKGNGTAKKLIEDWTEEIAEGVADMINIFQPDEIAIGGAVSAQGERLLAPIRRIAMAKDYTRDLDLPHTKITAATLGGDAGIVGAALQGLLK